MSILISRIIIVKILNGPKCSLIIINQIWISGWCLTAVERSRNGENTPISSSCTRLFQGASFFLNAFVLFLSVKIFVQNAWRKISSSLKCNMQAFINAEFCSLRNCFTSSLSSKEHERTFRFDSHLASA